MIKYVIANNASACKRLLLTALWLVMMAGNTPAQTVRYAGAMSKIHREGRADAAVLLDTLPQQHLYAIGPVENLRGEILVWNGRPFVAGITADSQKPFVTKDVRPLRAIFLVYAQVPAWDTVLLSTAPSTIAELEQVISTEAAKAGMDTSQAFPFLMYGKVSKGQGHIMYKDTAEKVLTPEVLKAANHGYEFSNVKSQFLGFYSQHHQSIFTHHDTYLHIHFRLNTKYQAGHLDAVSFDDSEPLYLMLPKQKR